MTTLAEIAGLALAERLSIFGAFHAAEGDDLPAGAGTVVLLGPDEPGFWAHVRNAPEWSDGQPDPLDRWSTRVIGEIARRLDGAALFPFGGPPYQPFYRWALRSGRAWASPVTLLVHDRAGLFVSYRGALVLKERLTLPQPPETPPCNTCPDQPCRTACPASALTPKGYDVAACHDYLDTVEGSDCVNFGCATRRACPLSHRYGRLPEQSAYHMRLFHR